MRDRFDTAQVEIRACMLLLQPMLFHCVRAWCYCWLFNRRSIDVWARILVSRSDHPTKKRRTNERAYFMPYMYWYMKWDHVVFGRVEMPLFIVLLIKFLRAQRASSHVLVPFSFSLSLGFLQGLSMQNKILGVCVCVHQRMRKRANKWIW